MTEQRSGLPVLVFTHLAALEAWFASQSSDAPGTWIKLAKKKAPRATLTKVEAIDAALCHGWIDGRLEKYDDVYWLIRFTPRRSGSKWSLRNRKRASELMEQGRMRPSGLAQIEAAIADGRWDRAYASASKAQVPSDLRNALNKNPMAAAFFKTLSSRNRYAILYRIGAVKKTETRKRKIREFVAMLERGETIHG
jgi:uncharacterized protein YdeI (YjbR/CyaY-like superfamily)